MLHFKLVARQGEVLEGKTYKVMIGEAIMNTYLNEYIEDRLCDWANWCIRGLDGGLGYPKQSIIHILMKNGYVEKRKKNKPLYIETNDSAEEMETLILSLAKYNSNLANAIRLQYIERATQLQKAKILGSSLTQFKQYLIIGKAWLAGGLTILACKSKV